MTEPDDPFVIELLLSGTAPALRRLHTPGADGRCPTCRAGGSGSARIVGPCRLWLAAEAALRLGERRP